MIYVIVPAPICVSKNLLLVAKKPKDSKNVKYGGFLRNLKDSQIEV